MVIMKSPLVLLVMVAIAMVLLGDGDDDGICGVGGSGRVVGEWVN